MTSKDECLSLDVSRPIWGQFYTVSPLYMIGTRGENGEPDMAPKHLAGPLSWENHFGFVCSPSHTTYLNIARGGRFSVSAPRPEQTVLASLAASPRCDDGTKPVVQALPIADGEGTWAPLLCDAYFWLDCQLERLVEGLGPNLLIIGKVVAARVHSDIAVIADGDPQAQLFQNPLLAFIAPNRFASVDRTQGFPFTKGFSK